MTIIAPGASEPSFFRTTVWAATWRLGLAYWLAYLVLATVLWGMAGVSPIESFPGKLVAISFCATVTLGMTAVLYRLRGQTFRTRAVVSTVMALAATPLFAVVDNLIHRVAIYPEPVPFDVVYLGYALIEGLSLFFGWSCLSVALLYSVEVRDRERLLAVVREEALNAQMRALRYQVSPHFLFNTLNSVASLIEEGASARAGKMVLSLSTFLRTTLTLDPLNDVSLGEELALQEEYLEIERERFSDRMRLTVDVPDPVGRALVPSLILQPLVENAMKHGVGSTVGVVEIHISAARQGDRLVVCIENDMPKTPLRRLPEGVGIGLKNVEDRLQARFGEEGHFTSGSEVPGRYRAMIDLPWKTA